MDGHQRTSETGSGRFKGKDAEEREKKRVLELRPMWKPLHGVNGQCVHGQIRQRRRGAKCWGPLSAQAQSFCLLVGGLYQNIHISTRVKVARDELVKGFLVQPWKECDYRVLYILPSDR